ncbi:MAG: nuclear transport factor 2 family protein [Terracidiphilus sp.]
MPGSANVSIRPACRHLRAGWAISTAFALAVSAAPYGAAMPLAQKHESRQKIDLLEDEWRDAILTSNTKTLASLLADDYVAITPAGMLQSRDEALESLRTGRVHFTTLNITDRKVRFYGSTAVVTSLANVVASTPDGTVSGSYRYTRVYVRDAAGVWKIVSFEASRVRDPGPRIKNEIP